MAVSSVAVSRKTNAKAATRPGPISGSVTRHKTERRLTPSEPATSSSPTGARATAARTETTARGKNMMA